jgi:hypothetical protein
MERFEGGATDALIAARGAGSAKPFNAAAPTTTYLARSKNQKSLAELQTK